VPRAGGQPRGRVSLRPGAPVVFAPLVLATAVCAATVAITTGTLAGCATVASPETTSGSSPAGAPAARTGHFGDPAAAVAVQQAFVSVIRRVLPSVVEIRTSSGLGSGVVFDSRGDIITNAHVIGDATSFEVLMSGRPAALTAGLVGVCRPDDLAVIRVKASVGLRPANFESSGNAQVGDLVLAIGSPLGLDSSVTEGIVSAVGRNVTEPTGEGSPGATLHDTIQTSAAINPGNSGGALVNIDGQVVGIPTLAAGSQKAGGLAAGIGFAIPAGTAVAVGRHLADREGTGQQARTCT
jgi:putative serine protease PepD